MFFSKEEIRDIIISVIALTIIFSYPNFGLILFYSFIIVITSFLLHELAHKFVGRRLSCAAFYKISLVGVLVSLLVTIFTGLKLAILGAVVIYPYRFGRWRYKVPHITIRELGIIAASGPLVNVILAIIFSLFSGEIFNILVFINSWLAFFNLLPIKPLDGEKVFTWKPWLWFLLIFLSAILFFSYSFVSW